MPTRVRIFVKQQVLKASYTYRSIRSLLTSVFSWPALQLDMDIVNDVKEVFYDCHFSIDRLTSRILKINENHCG